MQQASGNLNKFVIGALGLLVGAGLFFLLDRIVLANADYICTHIVTENDPCGNGGWSSWNLVSSTATGGTCSIKNIVEDRVYTGTRATRHILSYLNLRTACQAGYTQAVRGESKGRSGFHGGTIVSETAVCQVRETRTRSEFADSSRIASCTNSGVNLPNTSVSVTNTDISTMSETTSISSIDELNAFRAGNIDAQITVAPTIVQPGDTTQVKWQGVEVVKCSVSGSNGDKWEATEANQRTAGEERSGPITDRTTYELTCEAFNGTTVTDEAVVEVAPEFEEI